LYPEEISMVGRWIRASGAKIISSMRVCYYRSMGIGVGKRCYISSGAHIDVRRGKVTIGNDVSVASGSYILGHVGERPLREGQETRLEDNVKVFVNAVVLPGVTVGARSVVGAGAVVGKDVPPGVIVLGNPARVVGYVEDETHHLTKARDSGPPRERDLEHTPDEATVTPS
jgi:acetyltransferase-like isoleucine patch superfamily enzyme